MLEGGSRLRLGARIGRGGMAEVFAGRVVGVAGFEKDVAVKRVLPRYAGDPKFLERFLAEARLAAKLSHPNIVQIFELGADGKDHYIVMEAVRGVTLRACLDGLAAAGETMPVPVALHVAQAVCAGLAHAHELTDAGGRALGIVHRDVSPHNVLLGFAGEVKLIDFGIARARDIPSQTQTGRVLGKPHFMAPEQIRGEDVDARADLFAVGVVLYEMLAGKRPFDGDMVTVVDAIADGVRTPLGTAAPDLDRELVRVVERALAHRPSDRFESARAFGSALLGVSRRLGGGAGELEPLLGRLFPREAAAPWPIETGRADRAEHTQTVDVPAELTLVSESDHTLDERPARRRSRLVPVAASLVALVAVAALVVLVRRAGFEGGRTGSDGALPAPDAALVDAGAAPVTGRPGGDGAALPAAVAALVVDAGAAPPSDAGSLPGASGVGAVGAAGLDRGDGGDAPGFDFGDVDAAAAPPTNGASLPGASGVGAVGAVGLDRGDGGGDDGPGSDFGDLDAGPLRASGYGRQPPDGGADAAAGGEAPPSRPRARAPAASPRPGAARRVRHPVKTGRVVVDSRPWSEVRLGGRLLGITPLAAELPAGKHALRLTNPKKKLSRTVVVTVAEGKDTVVRVDLRPKSPPSR